MSKSTNVQQANDGDEIVERQRTAVGNSKLRSDALILVKENPGASLASTQVVTSLQGFPLSRRETSESVNIIGQAGDAERLREEPDLMGADVRLLQSLGKLLEGTESLNLPSVDFGSIVAKNEYCHRF